jgi:hypothetical protein
MEFDGAQAAVEGAMAYHILQLAEFSNPDTLLTPGLSVVLLRLIDDAEYRVIALDTYEELFTAESKHQYLKSLDSFARKHFQCSLEPDECTPTADTPRINKN